MKYYWLVKNFNDMKAATLSEKQFRPYDSYVYRREGELKDWNPSTSVFDADRDQLRDIQRNDLDLLIVSDKAKKLLEEINAKGLDFYKILISNMPNDTYWYVHLKILDNAWDRELSDYKELSIGGKKAYSITKPTFVKSRVEGLDAFRLKESAAAEYISERVRDTFIKNNISGVEFVELAAI